MSQYPVIHTMRNFRLFCVGICYIISVIQSNCAAVITLLRVPFVRSVSLRVMVLFVASTIAAPALASASALSDKTEGNSSSRSHLELSKERFRSHLELHESYFLAL